MRLLSTAALAVLLTISAAHARGSYYQSSDGSYVHGPDRTNAAAYGAVTADCRDGTYSYSHHHSGTCSGHGGVADWH